MEIVALLFDSTFTYAIPLFLLAIGCFYLYLSNNYDYWSKKGIPHKQPEFPFGSIKDILLQKTFVGKAHNNIYKEFPNERFYGIIEFRKPALVLKDPELIKRIMVKDFSFFVDRPTLIGNPNEYIMMHLLNLTGQEWKEMRHKLTPTFTSGKMKLMFELILLCGENLRYQLQKDVQEGKVTDVKETSARFTMDIIASCAFGIDTHNLTDENAAFFRTFKGVSRTTTKLFIRRVIMMLFPSLLSFLRINIVSEDVRDFVTNLVRDTIEFRQKNNVQRNDFLDLLINIRKNKNVSEENGQDKLEQKNNLEGMSIEQMTAQTFVFFLAGFETASSLMAFCFYELARHPDVQNKLYQEIQEALDKNERKLSYNTLTNIQFLEQVINETLRLYGSAHNLSRICTQTYRIPDTDIVLEKGMKVIIPLYSLHHDPEYYPEPEAFKPERFGPEEVKTRHPFVFMPFGEGPRNCIGMRFGLLEAKVGIATVVSNFIMELSPKQEVPIEVDRKSVALMPANPVLISFKKRRN